MGMTLTLPLRPTVCREGDGKASTSWFLALTVMGQKSRKARDTGLYVSPSENNPPLSFSSFSRFR